MKISLAFALALVLTLTLALSSSKAEETTLKRGLITSAKCPYSCKDANVPTEFCRERKIGDICEVEDLSQAPGHRSAIRVNDSGYKETPKPASRMRRDIDGTWITVNENASRKTTPRPGQRGLVTTAPCPYSCKDAGLTPDVCREAKLLNTCRIEDLTQAPGHRSLLRY